MQKRLLMTFGTTLVLLLDKFGKGHTTCQMFTENKVSAYRKIAGTNIIAKCINQYRTLQAEVLI
jgi:hypothetical protein